MRRFHIDVTKTDTDALVRLEGELDMSAAPEMLRLVDELCEGDRHVVIDLRRLEFIDSSGFAGIVRAQRRWPQRLSFTRPTGSALRALELTGIDGMVEFIDDPPAPTSPPSYS